MTARGGARRWVPALAALAMSAPAFAARLDVELTGVHGLVWVAVCTPATFTTKHCPFFRSAPAKSSSVVVGVEGLSPECYAIQTYDDEDGNGCLYKGLFGIPAEAIGLSGDAQMRLGAPSFEEAAVDLAEWLTATRLRLRYLRP